MRTLLLLLLAGVGLAWVNPEAGDLDSVTAYKIQPGSLTTPKYGLSDIVLEKQSRGFGTMICDGPTCRWMPREPTCTWRTVTEWEVVKSSENLRCERAREDYERRSSELCAPSGGITVCYSVRIVPPQCTVQRSSHTWQRGLCSDGVVRHRP